MAKVFAVNLSTLDYSKAEAFGELVYMTKGILNLKKFSFYDQAIKSYIDSSSNQDDYLMFSGPNIICALALRTWLQKHDKCNVLTWDTERKTYNKYEVFR